MAITLDYPSPTAMGVGRLVIDNGDAQGVPHMRFDDRRVDVPAGQTEASMKPEKKIAFAMPKAAALSLNNGGEYAQVLMKDVS